MNASTEKPLQARRPRIVSQSPYLTHALAWLGCDDCVVGVSCYDERDLPRTGSVLRPDTAAITALRADVLVAPNWADAGALSAALPEGVDLLQVDGFRSLADAEAMLATLAQACGVADGAARVAAYRDALAQAAAGVAGGGRRALMLAACNAPAYSFGRERFVGELFRLAGFELAETEPLLRHLDHGGVHAGIRDAVASLRPDIVFALNAESAEYCRVALDGGPVPWVALPGGQFFHPGPGVLNGLAELARAMATHDGRTAH